MSGICGIIYPDGRRVEEPDIAVLLKGLERRGPDGSHVWCDGDVGLGHALLATAPERQAESLPIRHEGTGCTITADVRLDNREDLIEALGMPDHFGDGALILHAYLKWDRACLDHLSGDFAFAIYDPRERQLFCARDQVGMRQLIWHHQPSRIFAFATDALALLNHSEVPLVVLEARLGDYLEDLEAHDLTSTFFEGLYKLPPAHALTLDAGGLNIWRYWQTTTPEPLNLPSDAAYAEAFREVFSRAVEVRLQTSAKMGSMLSGGMDSGSVTAVAAQLMKSAGRPPLATFSALRTDETCIESNAIRAGLGMDHIAPTLIGLEEFDAFAEDLIAQSQQLGEPFDGPMVLPRAVYLAAHRAGVKVMLDGVGGDTTLASEPMVPWYLSQHHFLAALGEARGERRFWGREADSWTTQLRRLLGTMAPHKWRQRRHALYWAQQLESAAQSSPLDPEFAQRIDMARRRQENAAHLAEPSDPFARHVHRVLHPHIVVARERYDRTAAALGIEPRDPFLDLRVLGFSLSLPQAQLQHDGWPKIILRRAMKGLLPDAVRWRRGKQHLGGQFSEALWRRMGGENVAEIAPTIAPLLKSDLNRSGASIEVTSRHIAQSQQLRYLGLWLNHIRYCNDRV